MSIDANTLLQAVVLLAIIIVLVIVKVRRTGLDSLSTLSLRLLFWASALLFLIYADYAFFGDSDWPRDTFRGAIAFLVGITLLSAGFVADRVQLLGLLEEKPDLSPADRVRRAKKTED